MFTTLLFSLTFIGVAPSDSTQPTTTRTNPPVQLALQDPPVEGHSPGRRRMESSPPPPQEPSGRVRAAASDLGSPLTVAPELRVIQLENANAAFITRIICRAFQDEIVFADSTRNAVIYIGPPGLAGKVVEMVKQLDSSGNLPLNQDSVVMLPIRNRPPHEIADQLSSALARRQIRISPDARASAIVLSGDQSDIDAAKRIATELDVAPPFVHLEFAFFAARAASPDAKKEPQLATPEDLKNVEKEIARFGRTEYLGRLSTSALQDRKWKVSGGLSGTVEVMNFGEVISAPAEGPIKIEFGMRINQPSTASQNSPPFELSTSVAVQPNDYLVLGSAPAGANPGDSIILVMRAYR
ncbi:MAG: hypothetical protein KF841_08705 [Phycisphaerae bacterium]|nr:hypothetical protein [Phycisphaerae bacterium]